MTRKKIIKAGDKDDVASSSEGALFDRVVSILEQSRSRIARVVNSGMVSAYWLIGREIVLGIQAGDERAEYGKQVLERLSNRLKEQYGNGFSVPNLQNFRKFYQVYADRFNEEQIQYLPGTKSGNGEEAIQYLPGRELLCGFSPQLTWSHYRALMRVSDDSVREFYEREAIECGWSKAQLERQIHSSYYQRIVANRGKSGIKDPDRERLKGEQTPIESLIKSPYVLEFLGLPDMPVLHESTLEKAIINNLQSFLLELGRGFSFVARQKHLRFDDDDFYVDLVFYNYLLKCFLLVDLKIGKLTHQDVGQMDGYVRLFEDRYKVPGDNPTIGLILCSDKGEAVAKYSILSEGRQIFASKYLQYLPSEHELSAEIVKERKLLESAIAEQQGEID